MVSCSEDKLIKVWNSQSPYSIVKILQGHTNKVCSVVELRSNKLLLSGSTYDSTLRFWNTQTYQCESIIRKVDCISKESILEIEGNKIIVGGYRALLIINIEKFMIEEVIQNERFGDVYCLVELRDGSILSECSNGNVHLWNKHKYNRI